MRKSMFWLVLICIVSLIGLGATDGKAVFADSKVEVGLKPKLLDIDVRFNYAYYNKDRTAIKGGIYLYKRNGKDASELSDYVLYTVDEQRNPISLINETTKRYPISSDLQRANYYCVEAEVDNVPFPANVFGVAVYAKSDTSLQNALAVSPIWAGGFNGQAKDGAEDYQPTKASFKDESPVPNEIKGKLTWEAAKDESRLSGYEVYLEFIDKKNFSEAYRVYVGTVSKGSSTYKIDIPATSFTDDDMLNAIEIYPKSVFGALARNHIYVSFKDDISGGVIKQDTETVYSIFDNPIIPENVKPIPAPKAPTAKPAIQVFVDGDKLEQKQAPFIENNTTLVQFRPAFEKLGLKIEWDAKSKTIKGSKPGLSVSFTIGHLDAIVNGETKSLAMAPKIINGSTYIPLRFVSEATGRKVIWDGNLPAIYIIDSATEGKLNYPDGTLRYEGQLKDGKMHGKGKLYREDGRLWYDAEFVNNEATGLGTIYFGVSTKPGVIAGEDYMIGSFLEGLPHGSARYYLGDGSLTYDGQFDHGNRTDGQQYSRGVMVYDGHWKNKMYDGFGKYYEDGFLKYEGEYVANAEQGHGKMYAKEGYVGIEGEFNLGREDGPIKMFFPNGQVSYVGTFKDSMFWGDAKEYYSNGALNFDGSYDHGNRSKGRFYYKDGTYFEGDFSSNLPANTGRLFNKDGELIYEGAFLNGKPILNKIYNTYDF